MARIRPAMQQYVDEGKLPGVLTLIARQDKTVHYECVGMRDVAGRVPVEPDTIFRIQSMSKPITSVAVMMLYEEGRFLLNDPVSHYLPEFKEMQVAEKDDDGAWQLVPANRAITIHDLLTHTGGISYGWFPEHYADQVFAEKVYPVREQRGPDVLRNFSHAVAASPLRSHPGVKFSYSASTDVLGRLVEEVGGMPFAEFLRKRIFEPLKMLDTGFYIPDDKLERLARMYRPRQENGLFIPGTLDDIETLDDCPYRITNRFPSGGGGLVSTAGDYLRFCHMLLHHGELDGERLLGRKTVELMRINHLPDGVFSDFLPSTQARGFGLGGYVVLHPERDVSAGSAGNFGWSGGANTYFWIDFNEQVIAILMTQIEPFKFYPIEELYKNLVYQAMI